MAATSAEQLISWVEWPCLVCDDAAQYRHWLEAALEIEKENPELAERMKKNYFTWHSHGDHTHVKGSFSYALITGVKAA